MKDWRFPLADLLFTVFEFLLNFTGLLVLWICLLLWEAFTRRTLPVEIKWTLYFTAFASASFWGWRRELLRARAAEDALAAEKAKSTPARIFVENGDVVLERYGHTGTLSEKLLVPYLDKWVQVSGTFEGATDSLLGDAKFVSLILENGRRIQLRFPDDRSHPLRLVRDGQQITAACQIQHGYGAGVFILNNCELIRTEPFGPALARAS